LETSKILEMSVAVIVSSVAGGGITYLFKQTRNNTRDLNQAFRKIRELQNKPRKGEEDNELSKDNSGRKSF